MFDYRLRPFLTEEEQTRLQEETSAIWGKPDECQHPKTATRLKFDVGGHKRYYVQCLSCGNYRRIKAAELKRPDMATLVDEDAKAQYYEARRERKEAELSKVYDKYTRIAEARREIDYKKYEAYLLSPEWKRRRELVLKRANYMCEGCGIKTAVQVHHLTYVRLYNEMLFDLVAVCLDCHKRIHEGS